MPPSHSDFDLWQALEYAALQPQAADFIRLCQMLDRAIAQLPESQQLAAASLAIEKMVEIYTLRANGVIEDWEDAHAPLDPSWSALNPEMIESWVRQSMSVNLDAFVEQPSYKRQRKKQKLPYSDDSVAALVDRTALLEFIEHLEAEQNSYQMIQSLAGEEHITQWSTAIGQWLQFHSPEQSVTLRALHQALGMPSVEIWLGVLLGGYTLEQCGDFYEADIFIKLRPSLDTL